MAVGDDGQMSAAAHDEVLGAIMRAAQTPVDRRDDPALGSSGR
jgi:hypothetical protein